MTDIAEDEDDALTKPKSEDTTTSADSRDKLFIEIWKQAVDTQKHFNDMCVKSRQLGLTFVAASLGAALYLFIRAPGGIGEGTATATAGNYAFALPPICGRTLIFHISLAIITAAVAAVVAVRKLDLGVYHQMLRGAVTFGEDLEEKHIRPMVGLQMGMTQSISHFSRHSDAHVTKGRDGFYQFSGHNKINAGSKLKGFYNVILGFLVATAAAIFLASNFMKAA